MHFVTFGRGAAACAAAILLLASPAMSDEAEDTLAAMRTSIERFKDVDVALADGYLRDPSDHCHTAEMAGMPAEWGVMGIHFFRPDMLGVTATEPKVDGNGEHLDWNQPSILIYEPQADGSLELVAVENLVFKASWDAAHAEPPTFLGRTWDHMVDNPDTAGPRRGARLHRALRPARLALPRQPGRRARAVQRQRHLRAPQDGALTPHPHPAGRCCPGPPTTRSRRDPPAPAPARATPPDPAASSPARFPRPGGPRCPTPSS